MKKITLIGLLLSVTQLFSQNFNFILRSQFSFPNEIVAGVWGYEKEGREYALVAGSKNLHIVEVTNPEIPSLVVSLPMANDWGKEVRTFQHFAYVSAEEGAGLTIYDLSALPDTNQANYPKKEIDKVNNQPIRVHTLHIDTSKGCLYLNGTWQGTLVFNLFPYPFSPTFAGTYKNLNGGVHDGYADNDTLFAAHIYEGLVAVVDMHDKSNPSIISTFETLGRFPHNTWITDDRRHLLASDEIQNGFVSFWDIGDLEDIREISRFRPTPGSGSVPHNAFILNNYAFASWYRDGVILLDLTRPENVIQVGRYDTDPGAGFGDFCCGSWGNYPYLSSGNVLVSDIKGGLFVLTPTYPRACYLEGNIKDVVSKNPLAGVKVFIFRGDQVEPPVTSAQGKYRTGQSKAGEFEILFYKDGYRPLLRMVELKSGEITTLDAELSPLSVSGDDLSVLILSAEDNTPLANIQAVFRNEIFQFQAKTDAKGWAKVPIIYADTFDVFPALWGRLPLKGIVIDPVNSHLLRLERGYYDDFHFDLGWVSEGDAKEGLWEKGKLPEFSTPFTPVRNDVLDDLGNQCYTTGLPTEFTDYDVYKGTARLISPPIWLGGFERPFLRFKYWLNNSTPFTERFDVYIENKTFRKKIWSTHQYASQWKSTGEIPLPIEIFSSDSCHIAIEAKDSIQVFEWGWLDVGLDVVEIRDSIPSPKRPIEKLQVEIFPNPFHDRLLVRCLLPESQLPAQWRLFDVAGRQVLSGQIDAEATVLELNLQLASGIYFFNIQQDNGLNETIKLLRF